MRGFAFLAAAVLPLSTALLRLLAPLCAALLCSACATGTEPQEIPETDLATPEAAAAKAQALPRPEGLSDEDFPAWLAAERERIATERDAAHTTLTTREAKCWRRFAVNACLQRARTAQREALQALQQQELALNAHERAHRARHVEQRLEEKAAGKEK
ncbi:MAG: hypothetical protein IKH84_03830, partial [Ottowia sp.]|nr:hypothetical protein [Ottowia sp.]